MCVFRVMNRCSFSAVIFGNHHLKVRDVTLPKEIGGKWSDFRNVHTFGKMVWNSPPSLTKTNSEFTRDNKALCPKREFDLPTIFQGYPYLHITELNWFGNSFSLGFWTLEFRDLHGRCLFPTPMRPRHWKLKITLGEFVFVVSLFCQLHPWSLTWNLKITPWKRRFLLETIIFRFHVKLWGCNG